jgi:tetratricopeptide (TPR) repeat protein
MKTLFALACLISLTVLPASAQGGSGDGGNNRRTTPSRSRTNVPDLTPNTTVFLSGKVVVDDGSSLTDPVAIQTLCKGQKRTEAHTDSHGGFSFQLGGRFANNGEVQLDADTRSTPLTDRAAGRDLRDCELQASIAGFTSDVIQLGERISGFESVDLGRIVLHRISSVEGYTVSATTAQAPGSARKAMEKGREQQTQNKWDDAQKSFEKAVSIFPKFATAWFELGRTQLRNNDRAGARHSFEQAVVADSKYVNPYLGLSELAMREQKWQELVDMSDKTLALNPVNFPHIWLWNSWGNYYLQNLPAAEKSARRGLQADSEHRVPQLEHLLGIVLLKKGDYPEAAEHLRLFLTLAAQPAELAEARKQLEETARLAAANVASAEKK